MGRRGRRRQAEQARLAGPRIESIPGLGTTWYERGPAYWRRRVGISVAVLVGLAFEAPFLGGFLVGVHGSASPRTFRLICLVLAVLAVLTGVATWRQSTPARAEARARDRSSTRRARAAAAAGRRAGWFGAALGTLAQAGSVLAGLVLVVGGFLLVGPMVALLFRSFGRYLYLERIARVRHEALWNTQLSP